MTRTRCLLPVIFFMGCATAATVASDPRRAVGTENAVRVDARINGDEMAPGTPIPITVEITNQRSVTIGVADILAETSYDSESRTVTVSVGSEVPGASTLPRLIAIPPGEKRSISVAGRVLASYAAPSPGGSRDVPGYLRVKVNFLGDTAPFADLLAMTQKATIDQERADELFPIWLEKNEAVFTNAVPMHWGGASARGRDASTERDW